MAARTTTELDGLQQQACILLQFWRPNVQELLHLAKVMLSGLLSRGSRENPILCLPFPAFRAAFLVFFGSWPLPPSLRPVVWHLQVSLSAFLFQGHLWLHLGPIKRIPGNFPIPESSLPSTKSLSPCKIRSTVSRIRTWITLGPLLNPPHKAAY